MKLEKAAELRLEQLLEEGFGEKVEPDSDGDYPLPGAGDFYVRLETPEERDPIVQVFAVAARDIPASAELFEALNRINANIGFARCFWVLDQVLFETEIVVHALKHASLGQAVGAVGGSAEFWGQRLVQSFGGTTTFGDAGSDPDEDDGPGQYL